MAGVYRSSWPEVKLIIWKLGYRQVLGQGVWTTYSRQQKAMNGFEERSGWSRLLFPNSIFTNLLYLAISRHKITIPQMIIYLRTRILTASI